MFQHFCLYLQYLLPQHLLSRMSGALANCRWQWLKNGMIFYFIKLYNIDLSCAKQADYKKYPSFNDFFIRRLKTEARPIATEQKAIISPVDAVISQMGSIQNDQLFQAKGLTYSLKELLGNNPSSAVFQQGKFITLYLSPKDYHRVHMPVPGSLQEMMYVPGKLFSVNPSTAENVQNLFTRNERVINIFETPIGKVAVIMVGAMLVGSMSTVWAGQIKPHQKSGILKTTYEAKNIEFQRGAELGYFKFGSTVIVLFEPNKTSWSSDLVHGSIVQMGQCIGNIMTSV